MSLILFLFSLTIMEDSENNLTIPLNMNISCPEFTEFSSEMLTQVSFWVEGALSCSVAMAGFLGNVGSVVILSGKEMRNSFNWLLIGLACFDNVYLLGSILESFRKDFEMVNITNYPFKRNSSEMINSWRDLFLKRFIPDGIHSWRDSFLKGFIPEGFHSWRVSFLKGFFPIGIHSWRDSFIPEVIHSWWDSILKGFILMGCFDIQFLDY